MADTAPAPLANFDQDTLAALTPDERAALRNKLLKTGFDENEVRSALPLEWRADGTAYAGSEPEAKNEPPLSLDDEKIPNLTAAENRALAENLRKYWTGDPAALEAAINGLSVAPSAVKEPADTRSDAAKEFDAHLGGVAPHAYDLNGLFVNRENVAKTPAEMVALSNDLRAALSAMQMPPVLGKGFAEDMLNAGPAFQKIASNPARLALHNQQLQVDVAKVVGKPYDEVMRLAQTAAALIPRETVLALAPRGFFESPAVIANLARQGERILARRGL